jgi:enamine deaminase RidA (YjgF/YER057c/UK114 family)
MEAAHSDLATLLGGVGFPRARIPGRMAGVEHHNPSELPEPAGYSHASSAGDLVFIGGQVGCDATGRIPEPADIAAQFARAIGNLSTALRAAGCTTDDVIKLTYLVTDAAAYRAARKPIGSAYREVFGRNYPASTLIEVKGLYDPDAMVEIEAVAVRSTNR